ncbi:MAG: protein kinase [Deltaproteobacteria bacterium]|nr:protein kinase [Deltaproteobacteria bacterium]
MGDPLLGRVINRRFRLEEQLGSGGMGVVYRARHLLIDRVVAIKILLPGKNTDHLRAWFLREARAVNRINHAHIVDIHDYGETDDGLAYLVMELLDGTPLNELIARGPMPVSRAADIIEQCCAALARAHDLGVIHRDLKPDNVFLLEKGGRKDFVKILDFGLARLMQETAASARGAVFGTPEYMSPEQTLGAEATAASDLYSLGVVFFEMLTGRLPFDGPGRNAVMEQHRSAPPSPPSRHVPGLLPLAESIVLKLLEKDPGRRYRDAHHLLEDVKALLRQAPRNPWETSTEPAAGSRGGARVSGIVAWSLRAAMFARMLARAFPGGEAPASIALALDEMWKLSALAARAEGEMGADASKLEAHERRAREFRAQVGRQIEELAREVSHGHRRISELDERRRNLVTLVEEARSVVATLRGRITALEVAGEMGSGLREAYQALGAAEARVAAREDELDDLNGKLVATESQIASLESQSRSYREQLERSADVMDTEAATLRRRVSERTEESGRQDRSLVDTTQALLDVLGTRPECVEILQEMQDLVGLPPGTHPPPGLLRPA